MKDVEGKVAFITGAANGAGFGMAQVFTKNGMKVVIADIRQDSLDRAMAYFANNPSVHAIHLDVTDREAFARAADEAEKVFGKVHVLCNNAGINLFVPIEECTYNDWDWVMGVNFGGVVNGIQTFIPRIRKHGEGGHIVNTASMAGFLASAGAGIYTASKYAVRGLSEALRCSLYPYNIGVSVFCPGLINSVIYESEKVRPQRFVSPENTARSQKTMDILPEIHKLGMSPEEVGEKVLAGIRRNDMYIFSHPEFREEMQEINDEILSYLPKEEAPAGRLAFEKTRRDSLRKAKDEANKIG
ncbi:MAG TPA: SDR family NAD(P)-dependent oxidoreductase [Acidobacteriota bacterium]|nr:SDR family NAD(P)-dependent oxidoreductase [Acidobacteriota bacterium]